MESAFKLAELSETPHKTVHVESSDKHSDGQRHLNAACERS